MRLVFLGCVAAALCAGNAQATGKAQPLIPGVYTNEEEVYFDDLAKRPTASWISIEIGADDSIKAIDAFQKPVVGEYDAKQITVTNKDRIKLMLPDGKVTELRLARPVSCWVAVRKEKPKPDGSEDWYFQNSVKLHDQGGRAIVGGGDTGAQPVMVRVRNVTWDKGSTNAPVITLYIHKPVNWERAESYSWAAPDSARVGINLRWMQAGCAVEGIGTASKLDHAKFNKNEKAKAK
jgi:hypothetical protein